MFYPMTQAPLSSAIAARILAGVFLASAALTFIVSHRRHLAWPVFAAIGAIALYGSQTR